VSTAFPIVSRDSFSTAIRSATSAVDEFVKDVERGYLVELR